MSKISVTTIAGLTSGGDANKVKIESGDDLVVESGGIGIGTTSPTQDLTIVNSGSARMELVSGTSGTSIIDMGDSADKDIGGIRYAQGTDTLQFRAGNDVRMSIDGSGRVTMPNTPRFLARKNTSSWTLSANSIMVWDTAASNTYDGYNIGSHYNTSNGKFTCPVAGTYYFEATSIINESVSNGFWAIRKNGSAVQEQHISQSNTSWHAHHIAYAGEFAANDTVEVYLGSATTGFYGQRWSYFHGRMIG